MAAYRLQADCHEPGSLDQLRNPTFGNRAAFMPSLRYNVRRGSRKVGVRKFGELQRRDVIRRAIATELEALAGE